jgi:hypothetical protein
LLEIIFGHHILNIYILDICSKRFVFYAEFRLWQAKFHTHTKVQISHTGIKYPYLLQIVYAATNTHHTHNRF